MLPTVPFSVISQIVGDITKESTLVPEYFKGVRKVINAVSVIVGPKEGDTPDRAKYSQVSFWKFLRWWKLIVSHIDVEEFN
jgi:hypothetical protein